MLSSSVTVGRMNSLYLDFVALFGEPSPAARCAWRSTSTLIVEVYG